MSLVIAYAVFMVVGLLIIGGLLVLFLYNAAKKKQQASFVSGDTIEFVVAGETPIQILENVKGWYYQEGPIKKESSKAYKTKVGKRDGTTKTVTLADGSTRTVDNWVLEDVEIDVVDAILRGDADYKPEWRGKIRHKLRSSWGFFWVSTFYPHRQIHRFPISKARLRRIPPQEHTNISQLIETDPGLVEVSYLLWRFPRPVLVSEIEFLDRLTASLVVQTNFQVVMPLRPVFIYQANFFTLLESLLRATIVAYCRNVKLTDFLATSPIGPESGFFAAVISQVNVQMIEEYGVDMISSWIVEIQLGDSEQQRALRARELAELNGRAGILTAELAAAATVKTAEGRAAAVVIEKTAEATGITAVGKAQAGVLADKRKAGGDAGLLADLHREAVVGFKGSAYVEGGASAGVMLNVPAHQNPAPPTPANPPTPNPRPAAPPQRQNAPAPAPNPTPPSTTPL